MSDLAIFRTRRVRGPRFLWRWQDRKTRVLAATLVAILALLALIQDTTLVREIAWGGKYWVNARFLFWGWGRFLHDVSPPGLIYNRDVLYGYEYGLPGAEVQDLPFAYPPTLLLLLWPLGLLGPIAALIAWFATGMASYVVAAWRGPRAYLVVLLALIVPTTENALFNAQTSLFIAALMTGGWRLLGRRPILSGILFGLIILKPQFGLLIPVALIAARQLRATIAAAITVVGAIFVSSVAFGVGSWLDFPGSLTTLSAVVARHTDWYSHAPTVTCGLRMIGVGPGLVAAGQIAAMILAAAGVAFVWYHQSGPLAFAALAVGTFFATPYAFTYDLPIVSLAALMFVQEALCDGGGLTVTEIAVLSVTIMLPLLMVLNPFGMPWGMLVLASLFALILRRTARGRSVPIGSTCPP
ncbi:MAG: DUF2029 domain-containing protein [Rhodospirillales bacterium]|nr:DUF2029 domain-containing protein [Rhodospirillales bacterium]